MLPMRKRHACMLASAGAAPGWLTELCDATGWLPRLRNAHALAKKLTILVCLTPSLAQLKNAALVQSCMADSELDSPPQALACMQSL